MSKLLAFGLWAWLCLVCGAAHAQSADSIGEKAFRFPSKWLARIRQRTSSLDEQLTRKTSAYLTKMMKKEERMKERLARVDSAAAKQLFASGGKDYAALLRKINTDSAGRRIAVSGEYQAYVDSLQGMLGFLQRNPRLAGASPGSAQVQLAMIQLRQLQAKMKDADLVRALFETRKQQISEYIAQHANVVAVLGKSFTGMKQDAYYYSQQVHEYKEMLNDPDRLMKQALVQLRRLPAFQTFMKENSQLAGLFGAPGSAGGAALALPGLQTKDQVTQQVVQQVSAMGQGGMDNLQSSVASAQSQMDVYKNKLSQLGAGNTSADVPDFRPNDQKTKCFWRRLEYGVNFQTTHNNYYFPVVTDFGLFLGYKLGHNNVVGFGASYKLGWGSGFQHIALSSQGAGLRSFLEIGLKGSFSAAGGFEYNYTTPFASFQQLKQLQYWTRSGLIGVSKTVSMKGRLLKKTKVQLLWDFLSYQQVPRTQPILFRIGYVWR